MSEPIMPVFAIERHRLLTDGIGVTTLVGAYGCPLRCKYCINPHAWNPDTLNKTPLLTPSALYDKVKIDELYFLSTGGGVTFGGGESLLHANFIRAFREVCGPDWNLTLETSLNVPREKLLTVLGAADNYIVDIKSIEPEIYRSYTGRPIDRMLENLAILKEQVSPEHIFLRVPLIPGYSTKQKTRLSAEQLGKMGFTQIECFSYTVRENCG